MEDKITQGDITRITQAFYADVRKDDLLAPIFASKIAPADWDDHISHIGIFWGSVFLKTGAFQGNPMRKHLALSGLTPEHFTRWLALFKSAGARTLSDEKAHAFFTMADRIARSFQMGLAFHHDNKGETDHPFKAFAIQRPS